MMNVEELKKNAREVDMIVHIDDRLACILMIGWINTTDRTLRMSWKGRLVS